MRIAIGSLFVVAIALGNAACSPEPPRAERPLAAKQSALVTIQFYDEGGKAKGSCAGVLVGPQAVLTAGHCAANKGHAVVTAPNAGGRKAESHRAWWFDWTNQATPAKSPQLHDVAILALDTPIALKKYPDVADEPIADGTKTLHVRRVKGKGKTKIAFEATPSVAHVQKKARAHYYKIDQTKGSLDSGAPVFDAKTGKIVAVASTHGKSHALYAAKTKSLTKWLRQQLLALLEAPPKPPAPSSATAPKPPTTPTTPPATKPPTSPTSGGAPSGGGSPSGGGASGGKMGKQAGKSTKAAGKKPAAQKPASPQKPTEDPNKPCGESGGESGGGESGGESGGGSSGCGGGGQDCNNNTDGDMNCTPGVCGAAEQSSSSADNCDTPCEGGDQSCQDPQCNESQSCECQGEEQCGNNQEDPFEDNNQNNENDQDTDQNNEQDEQSENDVDNASEDLADDNYSPDEQAEENESETGESDDYSEDGYDDSGSEDYGSEDQGSEDTGDSEDYGSEDNGGEDYGGDDSSGGDDYSGEE